MSKPTSHRTVIKFLGVSDFGRVEKREIVLDRANLMTAVDFLLEFDPVLAGDVTLAIFDSAKSEARREGIRRSAANRRDRDGDEKTLIGFVRNGREKAGAIERLR
jgi:hypothetical protein